VAPPRTAVLVLVDPQRRLVGVLPPLPTDLPWWQEVGDVVRAAREHHGVDVVVLRLLRTGLPVMPGGEVVYLAEVAAPTADRLRDRLAPVDEELAALALRTDPRRAAYAEVGGPRASLAWAAERLGGLADARQQRTWNLSSLWRLTAADGRPVWLKQVPDFFAHEAAVLAWLGERLPGSAPPLLAADEPARQLLGHVEGADLYDADDDVRAAIAAHAHRIQLASRPDLDALVDAGVPDRRGAGLASWIRASIGSRADGHPARALIDRLDDDVATLAACGLPDVLVHGDEHGGNVVGAGDRLVVLDWGDAFVGHPVFDAVTLAGGSGHERPAVLAAWCALWRASVPGCDPERALAVGRRVAALRSAAVYAGFLDRIEGTEAVFHRADVPALLDQAVALAASG
jgi:hypothetical protein